MIIGIEVASRNIALKVGGKLYNAYIKYCKEK